MNNKYKKGTFGIILVLLIIIVPLTGLGIYYHIKGGSGLDNPNKLFHLNNKLYFYNNKEELIGTYDCLNSNCDYASNSSEDSNYGINSYQSTAKTSLINNEYAFIIDGKEDSALINLYNVKDNTLLGTYKTVNNYGVGIENDYYIVQSINGTYGVISIIDNQVTPVIPFKYDYIALQKDIDIATNKIISDSFIVKSAENWFLIDKNEAEFTSHFKYPIIAFDANTVIMKNNTYNIYKYDGTSKLIETFKYLNYVSHYLEVEDLSNNYYLYDLNTNTIASQKYKIDEVSNFKAELNDNKIELKINNELKESVDIS